MDKRIWIAIVGFVVLIVLAVIAYKYFIKQSGQTGTIHNTSTTSGHGGLLAGLGNILPFLA